jgi:hypothetical protein
MAGLVEEHDVAGTCLAARLKVAGELGDDIKPASAAPSSKGSEVRFPLALWLSRALPNLASIGRGVPNRSRAGGWGYSQPTAISSSNGTQHSKTSLIPGFGKSSCRPAQQKDDAGLAD